MRYVWECEFCEWRCTIEGAHVKPHAGQMALVGHECARLTDPLKEGWAERLRVQGIPTSDRERGEHAWAATTDNMFPEVTVA